MESDEYVYGIAGLDSDGNLIDVADFLKLANAKLTIKGNNYSIITHNQLQGFIIPETTKEGKKTTSYAMAISDVAKVEGFNGAIHNLGGKVTISNTNFTKNESDTLGAAIRNYNNEYATGNVSVTGKKNAYVLFRNNISNNMGGAIYSEGTLTAKFVKFSDAYNSIEGSFSNISDKGGAVYTTGKSTAYAGRRNL